MGRTPVHELCQRVVTVPAPRRSTVKRALSVFLSPLPDMALRLPSEEFQTALSSLLAEERYEVVQVEGIEMAGYGRWQMADGRWQMADRAYRAAPQLDRLSQGRPTTDGRRSLKRPLFVFDNHNAEYVLQQRAFESDVRNPRRWLGAVYSLIQWQKLRRYERRVCRAADRVVAVSQADADALQRLVPGLDVIVVPNGVDTAYYRPDPTAEFPLGPGSWLVFTGKMDFRPNVDAVAWFCAEILPRIVRRRPDARFAIVGKSPHRRVLRLARDPHVVVTGPVDDIRPYIAGAAVYVAPLRMGSGTRLKVLEAMAMGKAIVTTTVGCEGIGIRSGGEALVADLAQAFAEGVVDLLADEERRRGLGERARGLVEGRYEWGRIVGRLEEIY